MTTNPLQPPSFSGLLNYWLPLAREAYRAESATIGPDAFGFVRRVGDVLQIAWRGTHGLQDWIHDAEAAVPADDAYTWGHHVAGGFQHVYGSCRASLLVQPPRDAHAIHITGHSLGGALALACAADLICQRPDLDITVVTFAGPRYGSPGWSAEYNRRLPRTWRVTNPCDLVPHLPAAPLFRHVGQPYIGVSCGVQLAVDAHKLDTGYEPALRRLVCAA